MRDEWMKEKEDMKIEIKWKLEEWNEWMNKVEKEMNTEIRGLE